MKKKKREPFSDPRSIETLADGLLESDEKFRALVEHAVVGIYIIQNGRFTYVNRRLAEIFGYERDELIGLSNLDLTHPEDRERAARNVKMREEGEIASLEYSFKGVTKKGETRYIRVYGSVFMHENRRAIIGTLIDETETVLAKQKLEKLANFDSLTGLYNRRLFQKEFRRAVAQASRKRKKVALVVFDVDNFKRINDTLGHNVGDELLRQLSQRIASSLRSYDLFARIGGDEFAVIMEDYRHLNEVGRLVGRIQESLKESFVIGGMPLHISVSLGISLFPEHGEEVQGLQKAADIALYEAKHGGRNRFAFFADDAETMHFNIAMEHELINAANRGELTIRLQPQVDVHSAKMRSAEALVRWEHPERGLISPADFLPLARELGILFRIDGFVIRRCFELLEKWKRSCGECPVLSVNVSSALFHHQGFLAEMETMYGRYGELCGYLELELTEEILIEEIGHARTVIDTLKGHGFKLSIDDFGTGYSSLSQLKTLKVDKLKIDRAFVKEITESSDDRAIVKAVVAMGHSLGLEITAEGVENGAQASVLKALGCDTLQGYFYARPLPPDRFEREWIEAFRI